MPDGLPSSLDETWCGSVPALLMRTGSKGVGLLQDALARIPGTQQWATVLDYRLLRLGRRVDAVVITPGAILVFRIAMEANRFSAADRKAIEDSALDLADFHAGCRRMPVLPILVVPNGDHPQRARPLPILGTASVVETTRLLLPGLLLEIAVGFPAVPGAAPPSAWRAAPYRPVPALVEAACLLYARHDVTALTLAQAGRGGLARTAAAVADAVGQARAEGLHLAVFVTGDPGAGKTLCGLDLAFAGHGAAFLTGNPTLVHVLREALVRDAVRRGMGRRAAQQRTEGVIQALPRFRDHHVQEAGPPPERILIIDEAQRCWTASHAISKTRGRPVPLATSEPGHLLDIMARHQDWSVVVCLLGGGQEIHAGEGGIAEWGRALAERPNWHAVAPTDAKEAADLRQRLAAAPSIAWDDRLHLGEVVRSVNAPSAAAWVEAVLSDRPNRASEIAKTAGGAPFRLTRSLDAMRAALRSRGRRQSGLLASSQARRLRAEGLGSVLPHQDEDAVARWFLDRWPDIRSADALEVVATEFGVQGLELDQAGVCWDGDLVRTVGGAEWQARSLRGSAWIIARRMEAVSNRLNAYRVLLTRARFTTVIWVPRGDVRDPTRLPARYDAVAEYLLECGIIPLDDTPPPAEAAAMPEPLLL